MSVITFYGNDKVETAQTTSMAAIATYLAVEQNYKILLINAKHNDSSLQECFWEESKLSKPRSDLETGISGLIKAIASNKTSPEIITNYTKTIFKDRLEILTDGNMPKENYEKQKEYMKNIIKIANRYYDLIFIDIEGSLEEPYIQEILKSSNLVVSNTSQRIKYIQDFMKKIKAYNIIEKENLLILIGKYDKYSKYNIKNLQRLEKIQDIYGIPYNTLFFEFCNEGKMADFIIKYRNTRPNSIQAPITEIIEKTSSRIIDKLKELQMNI